MLVFGLQLGVAGVLGLRLRFLQVDEAESYRLLAEDNRINARLVRPARGLIFDLNGVLLADNEQNYRVSIVPENADDIGQVIADLSELIDLPVQNVERLFREIRRNAPFVPVTIREGLDWQDVVKINLNAPSLPGIIADSGLNRFYPMGERLAHVVGYVGPVSDYDLGQIDDNDPLLKIPRFQIGKTGVENKLEQALRGRAGVIQNEVNAAGRIMRQLNERESIAGSEVQLTIDSEFQNYVQARLDGQSAAAVVIDLRAGDIRAIASSPTFDPNLFVQGISVAGWNALTENPQRPLAAKAVQGAYPPGSTFKMIVALAALEAEVIDSEETVFCPGYMDVSGIRFHCWKRGGHGNMDLHNGIKQSCDVFFYDISQRVGIDNIAAMARKLGLDQRFDLPLSAVSSGVIPDKAWIATTRGEDWRIGDTVNASIGQGYVLTSPLQLAVMVARIATGRQIIPRLIRAIDGVEQPRLSGGDLGLNENHLRWVRAAMNASVNTTRGTAYRSRSRLDNYRFAGKTGTSQVRRITLDERAAGVIKNEDLPWNRRDHALFVGFAPVEAPRYAVSVIVEHGGGGSAAAAPIARDILLRAQHGGEVPLEAYPSQIHSQIREQQQRISRLMTLVAKK